jgi:hypothetical protein
VTALPGNREGKKLVLEVLRGNPGASSEHTGKQHIMVRCPGLPPVLMSSSPGKSNHVKSARHDFRKAGYKLDA